MKKHSKKNSYHIDEIVLVLAVAFIALMAGISDKSRQPSNRDIDKITEKILSNAELSSHETAVDEKNLQEFQSMKYKELKSTLDVKNDFCVYLQDGDGKIILSKGYSKLSEDGVACNE